MSKERTRHEKESRKYSYDCCNGSKHACHNYPGTGKVYLLNFKPETDEAWQNLASDYSSQYGVDVTVLTAADGQYNTTLTSEMAKSDAPTIFTVGNATAAQTWNDYTYDLKDTPLYSHLTDKSLTVNYDGKVAAIANCFESYGIIYNKTILNDYFQMDNAKGCCR